LPASVEPKRTVDRGHGFQALARAVHTLAELLASGVMVRFPLDQHQRLAAKGLTGAVELLVNVLSPLDGCNLQRPHAGQLRAGGKPGTEYLLRVNKLAALLVAQFHEFHWPSSLL